MRSVVEPAAAPTGGLSPSLGTSAETVGGHAIDLRDLHAFTGATHALTGVNLHVPAGRTTALVGPAGAGKSTLLRCINRLHEETPGARVTGHVSLGGLDVYGAGVELTSLRRRVGMVFSAPRLFPTGSIADNVAAGLRLTGAKRRDVTAKVQGALVAVGLWDELSGQLDAPAVSLTPGHQQRVCIARTLVLDPAVILMDDPCAALDEAETAALEALIFQIQGRHTIMMATRSEAQAARIAAQSVFMFAGSVITREDGRYMRGQTG